MDFSPGEQKTKSSFLLSLCVVVGHLCMHIDKLKGMIPPCVCVRIINMLLNNLPQSGMLLLLHPKLLILQDPALPEKRYVIVKLTEYKLRHLNYHLMHKPPRGEPIYYNSGAVFTLREFS